MKRKYASNIILVLALFSFLIACLEGYFYYTAEYGEYRFAWALMTLQNGLRAFLFSPTLSVADAFKKMATISPGPFEVFIAYAYGVAVFLAPVCSAGIVVLSFELFFRKHLLSLFTTTKESILIFGYNSNVQSLLQESIDFRSRNVYIVTDKTLSSSEEFQLIKSQIYIWTMNPLIANEKDMAAFYRRIKKKKIHSAFFLEDRFAVNFSQYLHFAENGKGMLPADFKCYCSCDQETIAQLYEDFYNRNRRAEKNIPAPVLFSISQIRASLLLKTEDFVQLYQQNKTAVHLLINGFGAIGQQTALQAINLCVLTGDNPILIDIVDYDMKKKQDLFLKYFSSEYVTITEDSLSVENDRCDGSLKIRFHNMDVRGSHYLQLLEKLQKESPFSYSVICLSDADSSLQAMVDLEKLVRSSDFEQFPIAINLESDRQTIDYLNVREKNLKYIHFVGNKDVLTIERIHELINEPVAKKYHETYQKISFMTQDAWKEMSETAWEEKAEISWENASYYKRISSRLISLHDPVKAACLSHLLGSQFKQTLQQYFGSHGSLLQKEGNFFIFPQDEARFIEQIKENPFIWEMCKMEHRRWCYGMMINGWGYTTGPRNEVQKKTPFLVPMDALYEAYPEYCIYDLMPLLVMM